MTNTIWLFLPRIIMSNSQAWASQSQTVVAEASDSEAPSEKEEEHVELPYDPDQDPEERRAIRREYRQLLRGIDDKTTDEQLASAVLKANEISQSVRNNSEMVLDSSIFTHASDLHSQRVRKLKFGTGAFNIAEFLVRLRGYMTKEQVLCDEDEEEGPQDEEEDVLCWDRIGRLALAKTRRVPTLAPMYGPLRLEQRQRKTRAPRARLDKDATETQTQELSASDIVRSENETSTNVNKLRAVLDDLPESQPTINLFKLIVNPQSFSQTVENLFHLSFLVRDGDAAVVMEDDLPVVFRSEKPTENQTLDEGLKKRQLIFEIDVATWKRAIEVLQLKEPVVPTRHPSTNSGSKWYG
ncbi:Capsular associated protein [Mycena chlorophos]|uniref:Non-structural maintenance of chromosomes element 4 n=1 Tax=Mycena chlorophos TaxID=658473 RepID=A0A8H6TLG2_MYCCL|nr:Capsular associated protein [Mycena chlorophos]